VGTGTEPDSTKIIEEIRSSLLKTQKYVSGRTRTNTRLLFASMALSGASTLVAGVTSAGGPIIGSGIEGWRLACIAAAVLGFSSTISTGVIQQRDATDHLTRGKECLSKLRTLDLGITTGKREWDEILKEYEELRLNYPDLINQG
jgi:hypothetical protein